ncbi:MAG TPA: TonB-dependent receptor [Steroidobacteraceae bacterium]|nr:TonB-dependent receptor [Steroidobacteraceae bacterium]
MLTMKYHRIPMGLIGGAVLGLLAQSTWAQTASSAVTTVEGGQHAKASELQEVVVTGSRIRREASDLTTAAPLNVIGSDTLTERGYTQVGEALNQLTTNVAQVPITNNTGGSSGSGQQFPDLFNLGAGRTLTLVNGRRFVTSGVATPTEGVVSLGDNVVDTNMIPTGLLERVEVVDAGGSVVYGSGAIAGVVNYVLKDHFTGAELDAKTGRTTHGDYPQNSVRATLGTDFLGGRGNVAVDFEWSKSDPLLRSQRGSLAAIGYTAADSDPRYAGPNAQGIVPTYGLYNSAFWEFSNNGVPFVLPPGAPYQAAFGGAFLVTQNGVHYPGGTPTQFNGAGTGLIPYNLGTFPPGTGPDQAFVGIPFGSGGDGYPYEGLGSLYSGVERYIGTVIGHVDLTPDIKLSTELYYGRTVGTDPWGSQPSFTVLNNQASGAGAIPILASNPYLPASAAGTIANYLNTTLGPGLGFAWLGGAPLPPTLVSLSKFWPGLLPSDAVRTDTQSLRGLLALDGSFNLRGQDYYWELSAARGYTQNENSFYNVVSYRFNNAIDAVTNAAGQIVCGINNPTVTDPGCVPINPFGNVPLSAAAQAYVSGLFGVTQFDKEDDLLATLGGSLLELPAGAVKFDSTYEHRTDKANYDPLEDTALGLGPSGAPTPRTSGQYTSNELSAELLVPLMGRDFKLPAVEALEFHGAYRFVHNSVAGTANLWSTGLRWTVVSGVTLRATHGTNYRAPNLNELFAPAVTALNSARDPCDSRYINTGPNPTARLANCEALFAAHPSYNGGNGLATFEDPSSNFATAAVTTGGNRALANEVSHTWTVGIVLQPRFLPGFTLTADRIEVKLTNAITEFQPYDYAATCYDSTPQPAAYCASFARDGNGDIVAATSSFVNAGLLTYKGETYNVHYRFALARRHRFDLNLQLTHNEQNDQMVAGALTRNAGTALDPRWVSRLDAGYEIGKLRLTYSLFYLPRTVKEPDATAQNTQTPYLAANAQHSLSALYDVTRNLTVRAGVINFTDEMPSFPSVAYGDILGRRYFVGFDAKL